MELLARLMTDVATEVTAEAATEAAAAIERGAEPLVIFPNLGIHIDEMYTGFNVFGLYIARYGVLIACGMVLGVVIAYRLARRTGQNPNDYIDIAIGSIIAAVVGARLYYVVFNIDYYIANPAEIINIRNGGLAIYGGIIFGVACAAVMCKIKKISFLQVFDTCAPGIAIAQAIGRWGNFVNLEAYGRYTDGLFAMQIQYTRANGVISDELIKNMVNINGIKYIQVTPTFLYESLWCLVLFILIMIFRKRANYRGEVALWYIGGYASGRMWIEGLRTDSLYIGHTTIAVSQLLAFVLFFASLAVLVIMRVYVHKSPENYSHVNATAEGWRELKFDTKKKKAGEETPDNVLPDAGSGNEEQGETVWEAGEETPEAEANAGDEDGNSENPEAGETPADVAGTENAGTANVGDEDGKDETGEDAQPAGGPQDIEKKE